MPITGFSTSTPLSESKGLRAVAAGADGARKFTGVTLIKSGLGNSRDRNYYPPSTLERAVREGRFNKLRAYIDHPDSVSEEIQPERTVRDWAGVYTNPRYNPSRKTVEADLTVFRSHKWLADTVEDLQRMGHGDMIGLSINGRGKTEPARRRLEEAGGEEVDVNEVSDFLELRSTDIVTEAGAGGGFVAQMLESARRGAQETTMAARNVNAAALKALQGGDSAKALKLLEAAVPGKKAAPFVKGKKAARVEEADDEPETFDDEQDDLAEAAEDVKDAAVERLAAAAADTAGPDDEGDEDEPLDEDDDEDLEESDEDDGDGDVEEVDSNGDPVRRKFLTAAQRQRQHAQQSGERVAEAMGRRKIIGATGSTGTVNKKNTHFTKRDGHTTKGKRVNTTKTMGFRKGLRPGATISVSEAAARVDLREAAALRAENKTLRTRNQRLAEALNTHRTADHAQRLLESSEIPPRLHPGYLREMIGKSADEMDVYISGKLVEIDAIAEAAGQRYGVEGAGTSLRESNWGGGDTHSGGFADVFAGIPSKASR